MDLLPGVRSSLVDTDRIRMRVLEAGPTDGEPVVLVHGNLSTARFYEHLMPELPSRYRVIAPDMRGFGGSDPAPLDATRGLADWADDTAALLRALGVTAPPHLVGWSTGGAAIARFAHDRPVASLTFLDPVSPYGYGGTHPDGTLCFPDGAGSGGGGINPEVVARLRAGDTSADSPFTARSVFRAFYVAPGYVEPREDLLVDEILTTHLGDTNYPGDATASENWPGFAPGASGILNALSPRYCRWDDIVDLDPKPPVLWTHGAVDLVVADGSPLELGTLGASGAVPGWPGAEVYPPQPMVAQIRAVLERYAEAGGSVRVEIIEGAGHGPHLDAAPRWLAIFQEFLATIG
ncbi:MAG TPA: alpha/beta hydrolase [Pseudonocardia sp.]|nr:alpha/beta hydrolase [Pseudonocardia sp.]